MITIDLVVTVPTTNFSNCKSFAVLTKKNDSRGYLQFQGETEELALKTALEKIQKITGGKPTAKKIRHADLTCLFYHVHFPSSIVVYKKLLETNPESEQENLPSLRATRSSKSHYQFIERNKLALAPEHAEHVKNIYQIIYKDLHARLKQKINVNCGGVSGRSDDYDPATKGALGYSFLCESNLLLKQVYYFFYSYYNRKKENTKNLPIHPVILNQLPDSPNTRSPGGRIYRNFFGMGTSIYVLDQTTGTESKSVINLSLLVKTKKINEPSSETLKAIQLENKTAQDVNSHKEHKSCSTICEKNKEKLMAVLKREKSKALLFYYQTHNILPASPEDDKEKVSPHGENDDLLQQNENLKYKGDLASTTKDDEDILFSDNESSNLPQDADSKNEMDSIQKATLTKKKLARCKQEKEKNGKKRSPGQNEIFNFSAKKAAIACGLQDNLIYEWTHLIAHEFIGNAGQTKKNLVLATANCNTAMMHLELVIKKLILAGHTVNIKVSAQADNSSSIRTQYHCVKSISYLLIIDGKKINFNFDPCLEITPPKNLWRAMLASTIWELIKPLSDKNTDYNALNYDTCKIELTDLKNFLKSQSKLPAIVENPQASNEVLKTPIKPFSHVVDHSVFFPAGKKTMDSVNHPAKRFSL